jgi:hypothetical protein
LAKHVLRRAFISVNGVDLSDHCSSVTLEDSADEVDFTSFSTSAYREYGQGMKDATISADFFQDFATGSVDATHYPLYDSGGTFSVIVRPSSEAVSSTNPNYTMVARLYTYSGLSGAVGDANTVSATYRNAGTAGISRGTA